MRRLIASFALITTVFLPSVALGDEPTTWVTPIITPLVKGTPAPYTGVLLTPEAVAKVIA